jgi:Zn ribbon nucleic-acid-binding protein
MTVRWRIPDATRPTHAAPVRATPASCPSCTVTGTIALLTSMVVYFVCDRCGHRWHVANECDVDMDPSDRQAPC